MRQVDRVGRARSGERYTSLTVVVLAVVVIVMMTYRLDEDSRGISLISTTSHAVVSTNNTRNIPYMQILLLYVGVSVIMNELIDVEAGRVNQIADVLAPEPCTRPRHA
jgi:hypothetical protein